MNEMGEVRVKVTREVMVVVTAVVMAVMLAGGQVVTDRDEEGWTVLAVPGERGSVRAIMRRRTRPAAARH